MAGVVSTLKSRAIRVVGSRTDGPQNFRTKRERQKTTVFEIRLSFAPHLFFNYIRSTVLVRRIYILHQFAAYCTVPAHSSPLGAHNTTLEIIIIIIIKALMLSRPPRPAHRFPVFEAGRRREKNQCAWAASVTGFPARPPPAPGSRRCWRGAVRIASGCCSVACGGSPRNASSPTNFVRIFFGDGDEKHDSRESSSSYAVVHLSPTGTLHAVFPLQAYISFFFLFGQHLTCMSKTR
jgi:hypothetical protein